MFWRAAAPIVRIRVGCFGQRAVETRRYFSKDEFGLHRRNRGGQSGNQIRREK